jgi:4-hydroxyphenylpyruvate dioxygenase
LGHEQGLVRPLARKIRGYLFSCGFGRPTIFIEIIRRVGCMLKDEKGREYQKSGCGGFGKGNFSELFKSIEEYEKTLEAKRIAETTSA